LAGIGDHAAFNALTAAGWSAFVERCEGILSDEKVLAKVRELVLPEMQRHGPIEARIIDDTSFP
jgi:hypothetical protein